MNLGPYELNQIYTGDARELSEAIPDNSCDLIFTDPVYSQIEDYEWLAKTAARVLKPDSACLVWYQPKYLKQVMIVMDMDFYHQVACYMPSCFALRSSVKNMWMTWRGFLIFGKGDLKTSDYSRDYQDFIIDKKKPNFYQPENHQWTKNPDVISYYLQAFTQPNAIIFDPFTGGGTVPAVSKMLGRNYLAFEIDPATADKARERVLLTQPPLFVAEPYQMELEGVT